MKRSEYIETQEGRRLERTKRFFKNIWIDVHQEPGTKKNLSVENKRFFRSEIKKILREENKRAFRSDIILEIQFFTSQDNPPPIQSLTKNYLDLLHKPMPHIDSLERILFNDDDQIKLLISNYHFDYFGESKPKIRIRAYRYSLFLKDIELAHHLYYDIELDERYDKSRLYSNYDSDYDSYRDLLNDKEWMLKSGMEDSFTLSEQLQLQSLQESYLKSHEINFKDLLYLFQSSFQKNKNYTQDPVFKNLWKSMEKLTTLSFNTIPLGGAPIASGESEIFKQNLAIKLSEFKSKHKILFPLIYPIGITVFYTPPIRNALDLDNLARLIIPMLIETFNPPSTMETSQKVIDILPQLKKTTKSSQKLPKNSITNYQIVNRPRKENSPEAGEIDLFVSDGMDFYNNLWNQIDYVTEFIE